MTTTTTTGSSYISKTWAQLQAISPTNSKVIYRVSDIGVNGSLWQDQGTWVSLKSRIQISFPQLQAGFILWGGITSGISYSQTGNIITVTYGLGHGLLNFQNGAAIYLTGNTGLLSSGWYSNFTYVSTSVFTCVSSISRTDSGTLNTQAGVIPLPYGQLTNSALNTWQSPNGTPACPEYWQNRGSYLPYFKKIVIENKTLGNGSVSATRTVGNLIGAGVTLTTTQSWVQQVYEYNLLSGSSQLVTVQSSGFMTTAVATNETTVAYTSSGNRPGATNTPTLSVGSTPTAWVMISASVYLVPF